MHYRHYYYLLWDEADAQANGLLRELMRQAKCPYVYRKLNNARWDIIAHTRQISDLDWNGELIVLNADVPTSPNNRPGWSPYGPPKPSDPLRSPYGPKPRRQAVSKWPQPITNPRRPRRPLSVVGLLALFILCILSSAIALWAVGSVIVWLLNLMIGR